MEAIILAGGYGSRLKPLTDNMPKPLLNIANKPMLDYIITRLARFDINKIALTLSYLPDQIVRYSKSVIGVDLRMTIEDTPLGTAGGARKARKGRGGMFVVTSGDALTDIDYDALISHHNAKKADVTIAVTRTQNSSLYGVVKLKDGYVSEFKEKPKDAKPFELINCGVYVINDYVMDLVPLNESFDFARDLFPIILNYGMIAAYEHEGYWCDVGDFNSYYRANYDVFNIYSPENKNQNLIDQTAHVHGGVQNCIIGKNAYVHSSASLDCCIVQPNSSVFGIHRNSIIGDNFIIHISGGFEMLRKFNNYQTKSPAF